MLSDSHRVVLLLVFLQEWSRSCDRLLCFQPKENHAHAWLKDLEHQTFRRVGAIRESCVVSDCCPGKSRHIGHRAVQTAHSARTPQRCTSIRKLVSSIAEDDNHFQMCEVTMIFRKIHEFGAFGTYIYIKYLKNTSNATVLYVHMFYSGRPIRCDTAS